MNAIGHMAGLTARALAWSWPAAAKRFGFWYRKQTVLHPYWCGPIPWESRVRLKSGPSIAAPFKEVQGMSLILDGCWEPELTERILAALRPGQVFVDVGANMGYYTLLAARAVGDEGLVLAFEPSLDNLQSLIRNVQMNRATNVVVLNMALADKDSIAKLWGSPYYNTGVCSLRGPDFASSPGDFTLTPVARFAGIEAFRNLRSRIAVMKIDVEGLELSVLRGAEEVLRENRQVQLTCEISPEWCGAIDIVQYLANLGFSGEFYDKGQWRPLHAEELPSDQCNAWFRRI